jgi:hypothetical protein
LSFWGQIGLDRDGVAFHEWNELRDQELDEVLGEHPLIASEVAIFVVKS